MHPMFMATLCTIANTWMKPKWVGTDEWVNKTQYRHTEQLQLPHKKGDIMPCPATRKAVEMRTLSEVSKTKEAKYHMIFIGGGF